MTDAKPGRPERFPIQTERGALAHPLFIPWSLAEEAYSVYAAKWGKYQSLECLAKRGGFAPSEMDEFRPGWREAASEVERLKAALAAAEKQLAEARTVARVAGEQLGEVGAARLGAECERDVARAEAEEAQAMLGDRLDDVLCGCAFDLGREEPPLRRTECIYCGETAGVLGTKSAELERWRQHAATCPKHPIRAVEAERDTLCAEVERITRERDGLKESEARLAAENASLVDENLRLQDGECLSITEANLTACRMVRPAHPETWCVQCVRDDQHLSLVAERDAAEKKLAVARAESASRLKVLEEKAEEVRLEWTRAENAEGQRDAAQKEADRLRLVAVRARASITGAMGRTPMDETTRAYLASALSVLSGADHANK